MAQDPEQPAEIFQSASEDGPREVGRRVFIVSAACAVSGLAFFALRRTTVPAAHVLGATQGPATVTVVEFSAEGKATGTVTVPRVIKTEAEWRRQLSSESYQVTREAGTEPSYTGATWDLHDSGLYRCICCDLALFRSDTKFDSGTGWPSFWEPIAQENIVETVDGTMMVVRTAVSCRLCAAHLGHVFNDGPAPTGLRFCMNSAAMQFVGLG